MGKRKTEVGKIFHLAAQRGLNYEYDMIYADTLIRSDSTTSKARKPGDLGHVTLHHMTIPGDFYTGTFPSQTFL